MSDSMICLSLMKALEEEGISHLFRRRLKSESTVSIALVPKLAIAHSIDVLAYSAAMKLLRVIIAEVRFPVLAGVSANITRT